MEYCRLNKTGRMASRFGMGCMRYPRMTAEDGNEIIDEDESIKMIRCAIDNGVNYFDTAYAYPGSEEVLGKALKGGLRERVMISTKCPLYEIKTHDDYERVFDIQLKRLQVDYIDVYLFHCLDRSNWNIVKETGGLQFMEHMKNTGRIKQIGFSFHGEYELFEEIVDYHPWDICLIQLNILDRNHQAGVKGLKYATQKGIDVTIMEPLKGGLLSNDPPDEVKDLLNEYKEQRSLVEWAFRWLYDQKEAKVILSGVSSMEQLQDNLRIFEASANNVLNNEDKELISRIKTVYDSKVRVGCTACGYCMPCPAGVNIPEIFKVYNDSAKSAWSEFGKVFYSLVASNSGKDASKCMECRKCEIRCPQKIQITETLKQAHELMKQ